MPYFGQMVIGPPGSGKTTYIKEMKKYYENFQRRIISVNLDPANENIFYENGELCKDSLFDIDIRQLITLDDAASQMKLGPNASFMYVFDVLYKNIEWLTSKIQEAASSKNGSNAYFLFDSPGQTEIYCLSSSFKSIITHLTNSKGVDMRLCAVNLIESNNLDDIPKYIFSVFSVLNSMVQLELPQINVISKIDLVSQFKKQYPIQFYKQPDFEELSQNLDLINTHPKFKTLNRRVSEFVCDYGLVGFTVLDINNHKHLNKIACLVDRANGYILEDIGGSVEEEHLDARNYIARHDLEREYMDDNEDDETYN